MILCIQTINIQRGDKIKINKDKGVELKCQITLSCGCPTCAGGRFNALRFKVKATFYKDRKKVCDSKLNFSGQASEFHGIVPLVKPGSYVLEIEAYDRETGAFGRLNMPVELCA